MLILFTLIKHMAGLALVFFIVSLILVITDLENLATVDIQLWLTKFLLIPGFFFIHKWCVKKIADLKTI